MDLDQLVPLLVISLRSRKLNEVVLELFKHRNYCQSFQGEYADGVFTRLFELSKSADEVIEAELLRLNVPPPVDAKLSTERDVWSLVSSIIFKTNPAFSLGFAKNLIESCLTKPTNLAFALVHSDGIESLAKNHPEAVCSSLVEIIISSTDDSRSIYALKVARWIPAWLELRPVVFNAMLAENSVKREEARWVVNDRASFEDAMSFSEEQKITISPETRKSSDIRLVTKEIVKSTSGLSSGYAITGNGIQLSSAESKKMSDKIRKLLGGFE